MSNNERNYSILLVEDDDDHAELALFHLSRCAPEAIVFRAEDGQQALAALEESVGENGWPFDVVLLDLKLPKVDGLEVIERVRKMPPLAGTPIVVLSTSADEKDKRTAYEKGGNAYVVKPSTFEEYRRLMGNVVGFWLEHNLSLSTQA